MTDIGVLIVDDHPVVRQGIRSLLSNHGDISVVGQADGVASALEAYSASHPDVTLLDIRLADGSGLEVLDGILEMNSDAKVLMLSSFDDEEYVTQSLKAGAYGYVLKGDSDSILVNAVVSVAAGSHVLSPRVTDQILGQLFDSKPSDGRSMSDADLDLLRMVAKGSSNAEIADSLFVSEATVKRRLGAIFRTLGVGTRAEAAAEAAKRRLL